MDLNLLEALDALLQEGSVTAAARRLHLTPPAVSRSLTRLRAVTGDPLLVRSGRVLVPTPAAERMRDRAHEVLAAAHDLLAPQEAPTDAELERGLAETFTVRAGPDIARAVGPALLATLTGRAPGVRLRLVGEGEEDVAALRDGTVDLDLGAPPGGVVDGGEGADELHHEPLLGDVMVLLARRDGAFARAVGDGPVTPAQLAAARHVAATRRGAARGPLDDALAEHGLARDVVATVAGFAAACEMARDADVVALAPERVTRSVRDPELRSWPCPSPMPPVAVGQTWHRRTHTDPARRWLRARVREVVAALP